MMLIMALLSKENVHFHDQSKQVVSFFVVEFSKRNRKHVLCVYYQVIKTLAEGC